MKYPACLVLITCVLLVVSGCRSSTLSCPVGQKLDGKSCVDATYCGDFRCEPGESGKCDMDCGVPCKNGDKVVCTSVAQVYCDQNCNDQEKLFSPFLNMQEDVISCLSSYFQFTPPRVTYHVVPEVAGAACVQNACCCQEGGLTGTSDVRFPGLPGEMVKGFSSVSEVQNLLPDEHETTHFFLFHMLGEHPLWFSEAVAIQTNERVECDVHAYGSYMQHVTGVVRNSDIEKYINRGDAFLRETPVDISSNGGVSLADGRSLTVLYYRDLRDGKVQLSSTSDHVKGALFMMGLAEDFNCGSFCVRDIVVSLFNSHKLGCLEKKCEDTTTGDILLATNKVVGRDTSSLFELIGVQ